MPVADWAPVPEKRRKGVTPERRALNQHMHRHHPGATVRGTLEERFAQHDDLHWEALQKLEPLPHSHRPYQDGESDLQMAQRLLAEGEAATARE